MKENFSRLINVLFSCLIVSCFFVKAGLAQEQYPSDQQNNNQFPVSPPIIYGDNTPVPQDVPPPNPSAMVTTSNQGQSRLLDVLDLKDMDILDVLKLISKRTGINIVANQNVKGRITIYLKNIDVLDALKIIVEAYDWAYVKDQDIIKIMTAKEFEDKFGYKFGENFETRVVQLMYAQAADVQATLVQMKTASGKIIADAKSNTLVMNDMPEKLKEMEDIIKKLDVPIKTEVFNLSYATAEEVSTKITEVLTAGIGTMKFDARSNAIIISDTERKINEVRKIVAAFDQKDKQVNIEAKIVQVTLNDENRMGIDWNAMVANYQNMKLKGHFDILSDSDKQGKLTIGRTDDYNVVLHALETVGVTDLLSSPHIATVNNKEAKILVGSTQPYVTTTTTTPATGPTTTAETINFVDVGVKLYVTPMIHQDGFISLKIKPEVSSAAESLTTSNNNKIPIVKKTEAETTVNVKDGITVVIGGLMEEKKTKTTNKVPLLGSIPLVGHAFRSDDDLITKTEIVVFLTPQIMSGDVSEEAKSE